MLDRLPGHPFLALDQLLNILSTPVSLTVAASCRMARYSRRRSHDPSDQLVVGHPEAAGGKRSSSYRYSAKAPGLRTNQ